MIKKQSLTTRNHTLAATLLTAMLAASTAHATSDAWVGATDGTWATSTNWSTSPATVPGTGDTATFNGAGNGNTTIDLGTGVTLGALLFDTSSAAAYTIGSGGAGSQTLTLDNAGAITVNSGVITNQLFHSNIQLGSVAAATATFTNNGTGSLTIAGTVNANVASGNGVLTVGGTGNTTVTGTITKSGAGNNALKKIGSGTLTLSNGSVWSGTGASQPFGSGTNGVNPFTGPVIVQEGTLLLNGGTHTVTGEAVIGGITAQGGAGQNAKLQVDSGALNISSWLSVGRGNGVGAATSSLELNNAATVTALNMSAGFNGGNTGNLPKGTITLNGTSILSISNIVNFSESAGSNFTMNINDSATFRQTANTQQTKVGMADGAVGVINVNGGTATFERDLILGAGGTGSGKLVLNSGTVNVANGAERWLKLNDSASASTGQIDVNGGNLNLNTNTDLRLSTNASASGTNVINLNAGAISGYTGNNNGVFSGTSVVDLNQASTQAGVSNTFNLNGGTLTIGQVITTSNSGNAAFNFNGGTLRAAAASTAFLDLGGGSQRANVRNGGAIINTNGFNVTVVEALVHSNIGGDNATDGGLTKNGAGTLTLSGANTYTGATTVSAGTLALGSTGSLASGAYSIADGATFNTAALSSYSLASVGTTIGVGATTAGFFNGPTGALTLGNSLTLNFSTASIADGQTYNLFDFGSQTGDFSSVGLTGSIVGSLFLTSTDTWTGTANGYAFTFSEDTGVLSVAVAAIPEPSTYAAILGALTLGAVVMRRRRAVRQA